MRDIKFRTWDKEVEKMWTYDDDDNEVGFCLDTTRNTLELIGLYDDRRISCEFMQYTGLKDKNDIEIYEGDIIEGGYLNPLTNEFLSRKYIVVYDNAQFMGKLIGHSPYGDTLLYFVKGIVIGNIYENPELLEEEF